MEKSKVKLIKLSIFLITFMFLLAITLQVKAEGINGTTIVLNPRTWR